MTDASASDLVWEDPPPLMRPSGRLLSERWNGIALALKQRPGQWARLPGVKVQTNAKKTLDKRGEHFEVAQRGARGEVVVYARWNPEGVE